MARLLSGRVVKTPNYAVPGDRYTLLGLQDAEPNLGNPTGGDSVLLSTIDGTGFGPN